MSEYINMREQILREILPDDAFSAGKSAQQRYLFIGNASTSRVECDGVAAAVRRPARRRRIADKRT